MRYWASTSRLGADTAYSEDVIKNGKRLVNKIWNAARFVMGITSPLDSQTARQSGQVNNQAENQFEAKLAEVTVSITRQLKDYKLGLAAETAYNEFWHWYCDEAIEQAKKGEISRGVMIKGLVTFLQLLHPFVPFVTEAVWQEIKSSIQEELTADLPQLLINHPWPTPAA